MTFETELEKFKLFRLRYLTTLLSPLPHDPAKIHAERYAIEPWLYEALEWAADLEAFFLAEVASNYEKPDCKSYDYAVAQAADKKRWAKKAQAAVTAIESRSIKLSQSLKLAEGR